MLLFRTEPVRALFKPLIKLVRPAIGAAELRRGDEAFDVAPDSEFAAAPAWLADSVSW